MAGLVRGHKGLIYPTNFAVSSDTATVQIGYPYQIPYTITPANATNQKIKWTSSNSSIATVDNKGIITAVAIGTCTITGVYSYDGTTVTIAVTTTEIHTTGITLDKDFIEIEPDKFNWVHAILTPSNTSYPDVIWSSSDESIATVNSSGTVAYVSGGICTITATTVDGGYTASCTAICVIHAEGMELSDHSIQIPQNGTYQLSVITDPATTTHKEANWYSSDEPIATVSNTGLVTFVSVGNCTITAKLIDGGFTDSCEVACKIPVTGVTLNKNSTSLIPSGTEQLTATVAPNNATFKTVTWSSSDETIATVSDAGLITYVTAGTCTITCTTDDGGYTATCAVVCKIPVTGITLNETDITISIGETFQLTATVSPEYATYKTVNWSSSNTSVATVSSTGLVTCIADGESIITATTVDGGFTATCNMATGWTPSSNTLIYYPFDGKDLTDYSGNHRDGSWYNGAGTYDYGIKGVGVKVAGTRGITSPVYLPSGDFTYSVWCNIDSISSQLQSFLGTVQWSSSYPSFHFHFSSSSNIAMGFSNGASDIASSEKLTIGKRTNIILVHSGNSWLIYKDKRLIASGDRSVSLAQSGLTWTFGCEYTDGRPIQGRIDEVILENKAWSVTDITKYYDITMKKYDYTTEYQPVEYIESTGSQVIKTGVYMDTTGYRADLEYQNTSTSPSDQAVFGFYMDSEAYAYRTGYNANDSFTLSKGATSLERQTATGVLTTRANSSYQFYIFAKQRYANGNYDSGAYCKLYSCKIYNPSNELIRDFVPCYRRSDGAIGLYDKVEKIFYTNQGSGTFNKGPNVGISLNKNRLSLENAGDTYQLTVTANPSSIGDQGYIWSSSDTTVATVSNTGLVTCITPGNCTITCTPVSGGYVDKCIVTPKISDFDFYYDFRGGSLAGFQAAGGTGIWTNGSYTIDSGGLGQTGGSNDRVTHAYITGLNFEGATFASIERLGYWYSGSWSNGKGMGTGTSYNGDSGFNGPGVWGRINLNTSSPGTYSTNGINYYSPDGEVTDYANYAASGGETTERLEIDFINNTAKYILTGANSRTFQISLTATQKELLRLMTCAGWNRGRGYSSYNSERIRWVKVHIEY